MEQLEVAVECGDVKELEDAIAAGQSALRHSSLYLPLSSLDNDKDEVKFNRQELEQKITTAKKLFVSHLEKCKVYIKALRKATRSRNYKMVKEALQMAHTAPVPVQRFMWKDMQATQELLGKLTKVRAETRQVLKCRKWQQIDQFLNEHAQLLDDRTILALVQTREDLIRAERQINNCHVQDKDAHVFSHKHADQRNDTTRQNENMVRSPHLHSVRVPSSAHHASSSLHNRQNVNNRGGVNSNYEIDANHKNMVQDKSARTRHPQALVKTYTLPFTEPESYLPLHNKVDYANDDEFIPIATGERGKSLHQETQWKKEQQQKYKYGNQWHDKSSENNNQPNYHVTENVNKESNRKQDYNKEDRAEESKEENLQTGNDNRGSNNNKRRNYNNINIDSNRNRNRTTKYELYKQEEVERENIAKEEMQQRSTIYVDELMEFAPPCLRNNTVLTCKEGIQERKSEEDNINTVIWSELKSPFNLNNITAYRTLPVIRYSSTSDISPIQKHSYAYEHESLQENYNESKLELIDEEQKPPSITHTHKELYE